MAANPYGTFNDEQLQAILQMEDFNTQEKRLAQQELLAAELRKSGNQPSSGRHWTRQLGRGLQGAAGAVSQYKAGQAQQDLADKRNEWFQTQARLQAAKNAPPQAPQTTVQAPAQPIPGILPPVDTGLGELDWRRLMLAGGE